ncbi:MAG: amino acid ABC transporter permease [Aurantimonas endophytica]|uniref:General L-amino acid transport system permease protein n=1 Tax=Aurantimonas endophytica TaxID=1522175 RepID=A0A7W6H9Y5_9HYPH|nr:amino acid ABC transporter permease [Aurantimonas endophytica]MBB4001345.1 general L-amino acid transport system permease protein [Aurantimonas endophytica]MCO6403012.1 ABC transporter permease subunit [Aurantimonas endophytica]
MTAETHHLPRRSSTDSLLTNPTVRSIVIQVSLIIAIVAFAWWIIDNTARNLAAANIASGFGFLGSRAGFDIAQVPIEYSSNSTYGRALLVGIANTLLVAGSGIIVATIIGFIVGIARLSQNFLVRMLATVYVETFRNIPPLLVILFWYFGVLSVLSGPRGVDVNPLGIYLTNRGLQVPTILFDPLAWATVVAFAVGIVGAFVLARRNKARQLATGERRPLLWPSLGLIIGLPIAVFLLTGLPAVLEFPEATRFNLVGGFQMRPEFIALLLALAIYTAAFIAEIVRAGILSVSGGQTEAASALGLKRGHVLRLVVVPQAFRVIIPPLTSQYLNLTKNSSLGLAIGYPELVAVGSTVLNQSGQSIEVVVIWMVVYLSISLTVSLFMNWFNSKMALVER